MFVTANILFDSKQFNFTETDMTTTNKFFETKDQYLAFRAAFAAAQNNLRAKKGQPDSNGYKAPGWLTASHYMLLNEARGLPRYRGFTPITSKVKLDNGMDPAISIHNAERILVLRIKDAKDLIENKPAELSSWEVPKKFLGIGGAEAKQKAIEEKTVKRNVALKAKLDAFLEPFNGTFTIANLAKIGQV